MTASVINKLITEINNEYYQMAAYHNPELHADVLDIIRCINKLSYMGNQRRVYQWCACLTLFIMQETQKYRDKINDCSNLIDRYFSKSESKEPIDCYADLLRTASRLHPEGIKKLIVKLLL